MFLGTDLWGDLVAAIASVTAPILCGTEFPSMQYQDAWVLATTSSHRPSCIAPNALQQILPCLEQINTLFCLRVIGLVQFIALISKYAICNWFNPVYSLYI